MQKVFLFTTILFIGLNLNAYSQFPVGKNIKVAKGELKQYLKAKGFNYLKGDDTDKDLESLEYSEEFSIVLGKNHYENVFYLNFSTFRKKIFERLKIALNFSKWTYVGEFPNVANEIESIYRFDKYKIRMPHPDGSYQFIVKLDEE